MFPKSLRAQRAGRVAPRRGGAKRRAAALGAAQRRKAPPQAAERRAAHKACFSAFNFPYSRVATQPTKPLVAGAHRSTVLDHAAFTARPGLFWLALDLQCSCGRDAERVQLGPNAFSGITKLQGAALSICRDGCVCEPL